MARKRGGSRAYLAQRIKKLEKDANALAGRLQRSSRPATVEKLSTRGAALERKIREAKRQIRVRSTVSHPGVVSAPPPASVRKSRLPKRQAPGVRPILGQVFTVRGSYGRKGKGTLNLDIQLTWRGLVPPSHEEVRQAVRALAHGEEPDGFTVDTIEYGKRARSNRARSERDLQNIAQVVNAMPLIVTGENE